MSDVVSSDGNGVDLIEELRARKPDIGILLNSGYTDERSQWPAICEKGFRFLHKPFTLIDLLQAVRAALDRPGPDDSQAMVSDSVSHPERHD